MFIENERNASSICDKSRIFIHRKFFLGCFPLFKSNDIEQLSVITQLSDNCVIIANTYNVIDQILNESIVHQAQKIVATWRIASL